MIRIDFKEDGEYVKTTWIAEKENHHSLMGRLTLTKEQFKDIEWALTYKNSTETPEIFSFNKLK